MKKQIATISILCLFLLLSGSAVKVSAGGGTCSIPSCRPRPQVASAPAPAPAQDLDSHQLVPTAPPDSALSYVLSAVRWVIGLPYFL